MVCTISNRARYSDSAHWLRFRELLLGSDSDLTRCRFGARVLHLVGNNGTLYAYYIFVFLTAMGALTSSCSKRPREALHLRVPNDRGGPWLLLTERETLFRHPRGYIVDGGGPQSGGLLQRPLSYPGSVCRPSGRVDSTSLSAPPRASSSNARMYAQVSIILTCAAVNRALPASDTPRANNT